MLEKEVISFLGESAIFQGLNHDDLRVVYGISKRVMAKKGMIILEEGKINLSFFLIFQGKLEVFLPQTKERPNLVRLNTMVPGGCLGEYSLIDRNPASASVIAKEDSVLFKMNRMDFDKAIKTNNRVGKLVYRNLLNMLIHRLRDKDREMDLMFVKDLGQPLSNLKDD